MGIYLGKDYSKDIDDYLDDIVSRLKMLKDKDTASSIQYLSDIKTRRQFNKICREIRPVTFDSEVHEMLGLVYIEIQVKTSDSKVYTLNFWPCSCCACIGVQLKQ